MTVGGKIDATINSLHAGQFFMIICFVLIFSKSTFSKKYFRNTIRVSNNLDPDQVRHSIGPDLGPNCSQRLSAGRQKVNPTLYLSVTTLVSVYSYYSMYLDQA